MSEDIKNFWGERLGGDKVIAVEHKLPESVIDKEGQLWVLEIFGKQLLPDNDDSKIWTVRYSRYNERAQFQGCVEAMILEREVDKLKEDDFCKRILAVLAAMVEDKNREAKEFNRQNVMVNRYKSVPKRGN